MEKPILGICIFLILVTLGLAIGFIGGFFGISILILFISGSYAIFFIASYFILKILPQNVRKIYERHKFLIGAILFCCLIFSLFVNWVINHYILPHMFHPVSIFFNVCFLFLVIFLGWCLIKPNKARIIVTFLLFLALFGFLAFKNKVKDDTLLSNVQHRDTNALEQLRALPYLSWSESRIESKTKGVVKYDLAKSSLGYNLYTDDKENAFLMDMSGEIVHRWRFPSIKGKWEYVELLDRGEIVAICVGKCIVKLDRNSEVIWKKNIPVHHDIEVTNENIYLVACSKPAILYNLRMIRFDVILHLSEKGDLLDEWSTLSNLNELQKLHSQLPLDLISNTGNVLKKMYFFVMNVNSRFKKQSGYDSENLQSYTLSAEISFVGKADRFIIRQIFGISKIYEYYHLNTVEVLPDTKLGAKDKRFQRGNYLICLRNADLILILDKKTKDIVWSWGPGVLDWPHMPTMINNGNILIFDNGAHRTYSRVIEINPVTGSIVWEYRADIPENFYSKWRGSNQRLSNGNTLICESENGRVFEVTRDREIVWEFFNPEIRDEKRQLIYRMMRVLPEKVESWLELSH